MMAQTIEEELILTLNSRFLFNLKQTTLPGLGADGQIKIYKFLLQLYDDSWTWEPAVHNSKSFKTDLSAIYGYLKRMDLGHLATKSDDVVAAAKIVRILQAVINKLEARFEKGLRERINKLRKKELMSAAKSLAKKIPPLSKAAHGLAQYPVKNVENVEQLNAIPLGKQLPRTPIQKARNDTAVSARNPLTGDVADGQDSQTLDSTCVVEACDSVPQPSKAEQSHERAEQGEECQGDRAKPESRLALPTRDSATQPIPSVGAEEVVDVPQPPKSKRAGKKEAAQRQVEPSSVGVPEPPSVVPAAEACTTEAGSQAEQSVAVRKRKARRREAQEGPAESRTASEDRQSHRNGGDAVKPKRGKSNDAGRGKVTERKGKRPTEDDRTENVDDSKDGAVEGQLATSTAAEKAEPKEDVLEAEPSGGLRPKTARNKERNGTRKMNQTTEDGAAQDELVARTEPAEAREARRRKGKTDVAGEEPATSTAAKKAKGAKVEEQERPRGKASEEAVKKAGSGKGTRKAGIATEEHVEPGEDALPSAKEEVGGEEEKLAAVAGSEKENMPSKKTKEKHTVKRKAALATVETVPSKSDVPTHPACSEQPAPAKRTLRSRKQVNYCEE